MSGLIDFRDTNEYIIVKIKSLLTLAATAAFIVSASATVTRHEAANFGYNYYYAQIGQIVATNNIPYPINGPYDPNIQYGGQPLENSIRLLQNGYTHGTGSYSGQDGIAEFSVTGLANAQFYYLEVSPWATGGDGGMASFDIFKAYGNGLVQPDDFDAGTFFSSVSLSQGGIPAGWYNPNPYGGFYGDSYVDITLLVEESKNAGESFLLFRYDTTDGNLQLFRAPAILASDSILENQWGTVPEPTSMLLTMLAGGLMLIRRKR